jgi:hypothetical protein
MKFLRTYLLASLVIALMTFAVGCAISDYTGWAKHKTAGESALWGSDTATRSANDADSGTFNYTVKYDCSGNLNAGTRCVGGNYTITTYRNPGFSTFPNPPHGQPAFSWYGIVDRDGNNINGRYGSPTPPPFNPTEKFGRWWVYVDSADGCQFQANQKQNFSGGQPGILLCILAPFEEVTGVNQSLENFSSLDDLSSQIWSNGLGSTFSMNVTAVDINGIHTDLVNPASAGLNQNGFRALGMSYDATSAGAKELIQAILNSTTDGAPANVSVTFSGGLKVSQPANVSVAFNHSVLRSLL